MQTKIEGSLAMVPALVGYQAKQQPSVQHRLGEIFQTSLMSALFQGIYEGEVTYESLSEHGDFGIGTFNDLDGEMVAIDGRFYQLLSNGTARPVDSRQKTPFAVVTYFKSTLEREINETIDKAQVEELVAQLTETNMFYAVKIVGLFASVTTRTVQRQEKPFAPLSAVAAAIDPIVTSAVHGTLAGFVSPAYAQTITGPNYHLHFLRDDRRAGGHALDYTLAHGRISIAPQHALHIELPQTLDFEHANLRDSSLEDAIRGAEG